MASSLIQNRHFGEVETKTFPFTADKDGIVICVVTPQQSATSYLYVSEDDITHARGYTASGMQYTLVFPVKRGRVYAIQASANYSFNNGVRLYPL